MWNNEPKVAMLVAKVRQEGQEVITRRPKRTRIRVKPQLLPKNYCSVFGVIIDISGMPDYLK